MSQGVSQAERASILESLSSTDEEVRRLAVEQLLVLPISEAVDQLYECLGDSGWRVRKAAVQRLVVCGGQAPVQEMLISSLADGENPGRRNSAFEALVGCGPRATTRLIKELDSPDVDVRKMVIDALAAIGDPTARGPLVDAIDDEDANIRAAAVEALGVVGGSQEIERLVEIVALSEEDVLVRLSALRALSRLDASVGVARLASALTDSLLRPAAFELLGRSADPTAEDTLLKGLSSSGRSGPESAIAALLCRLGRLDDLPAYALRTKLREAARASDGLVAASCERLETADLARQLVLIQFLGLLDDPKVVLPILHAGRDEAIEEVADTTLEAMGEVVSAAFAAGWAQLDEGPKCRACKILGSVGGETAERLLVEGLDVRECQVRCYAANALGEGGFFDRVPELARQLEKAAKHDELDSEDEIAAIIGALVRLAERSEAAEGGVDVQLIEVLSSRLAGAPEPVRLAIAKVLARLGRPQDEDIIGYLLKDESASVRRAAVSALSRFELDHTRDSLRVALADEATVVRIEAAKVIGESGSPEAIDDLRRLTTDNDPRVVAVAIRSLGRLYEEDWAEADEICELIGQALESGPVIALAGFDALREIGGERIGALARGALERSEPDVVRAAVACLGAHAVEEDLIEIIAFVGHSDWSVRAEIAEVLSARRILKGLPALLRRLEVEDDEFVRQVMLRAISQLEG
jgi:HEAT repeat protein